MSDETILQEAQRLVHGDRGADYGHPIDDYTRVARLWEPILGLPPLSIDPANAAMCMIAVKISRECHKAKRDNRTDMAGYAEVVDLIRQRQAQPTAATDGATVADTIADIVSRILSDEEFREAVFQRALKRGSNGGWGLSVADIFVALAAELRARADT